MQGVLLDSDKKFLVFTVPWSFLESKSLLSASEEDDVNEYFSTDLVQGANAETPLSNFSDSDAFNEGMRARGYENRGRAKFVVGRDSFGNANSAPPTLPGENTKLTRSGGALVIKIKCKSTESKPALIQNTADIAFYSGHGGCASGVCNAEIQPGNVKWTSDINTVVFNACHQVKVLDPNDNFNSDLVSFVADSTSVPISSAIQWATVPQNKPNLIVGYSWLAPADSTGLPVQVIDAWARTGAPTAERWMSINATASGTEYRNRTNLTGGKWAARGDGMQRGYNAAVLDMSAKKYHFFYYDKGPNKEPRRITVNFTDLADLSTKIGNKDF
jgi:hypothetical protein